jgi:hypothetical protein
MAATSTELRIGQRFCGPPGVANGGFACGSIVALVGVAAAEVTLRRPLPLGRPLAVRGDDGGGVLLVEDGDAVLAQARPAAAEAELAAPAAVSFDESLAVAGRARYYQDPVFPGCFVCGPSRQTGDGLRIFAGPVAGHRLWAAPWIPDPSVAGAGGTVRPEVVWAALDCPSGLAAAEAARLPADTSILLGRMTASLAAPPRAGDRCRVLAWPGGRDGRKVAASSALLGPGGQVLAAARTVWVSMPRVPSVPAAGAAP